MNIDTLTNSQQQVFVLLIRGKSNLEIASELGKTKKTVKAHVTQLYRKLGYKTRAKLIVAYYTE